jgi:integrase
MHRIRRLTTRFVGTVTKPDLYPDGAGLWLQVNGPTSKSWIFRFTRHGRTRDMGLGSLRTVSLADARDQASICRRQLLDGIDPIEARRAKQMQGLLAAASTMTFEECGKAYIAAHESGWRNAKHRQQWRNTLDTYVYPVVGTLPVQAVDTPMVMRILEPIWAARPETAGRVRGRIESILNWATVRQFRAGENPARWKGHLDHLLPRKGKIHKVRHQPAMPYQAVPGFMAELRDQASTSARALEFTILTVVRTSETIGATRPEIDREAKIWTIPAGRIKAERDHRAPLSDRAIEILDALPREEGNDHLFIGAKKGKGLSNMAMLELLRGMDGNGYTVHGFRSSFRDWCAEQTNFPREIAEAALAHRLKDKTEAAYQRGDLLEKRRRLMQAWAKFCMTPPQIQGKVVPMATRR